MIDTYLKLTDFSMYLQNFNIIMFILITLKSLGQAVNFFYTLLAIVVPLLWLVVR